MNWSELRDSVDGTCIIVGNGPSLNDIPVKFLNYFPSFGTNRIYLKDDFHPWYYVATNPLVISQFLNDIKNIDCLLKFVPDNWESSVPGSLGFHVRGGRHFSKDGEHIHEGFTVTYVCMQLAYFMGFRRVLLVGVDHHYIFSGSPNAENILIGADKNHFDQSYFLGKAWNNPDLAESELSYQLAKFAYMDDGREIINCSTQSKLEVFPRGNWRDYVQHG